MSLPQRNLLIAALTLVAAGLLGLGVGWLDRGIDETQPVDRAPGVVPMTGAPPGEAQTDSLSVPSGGSRTDAADTPLAALEVRVVDPHGAPLPQATIRATTEASGEALQARGRTFWTELEPGAWQLEVTHADYPTHRTRVFLTADQSLRHIVQLDTLLPVRGRVIDRFGRPRAATEVWFLKPGERHPSAAPPGASPAVPVSTDLPLLTVCGRRGRFEIDLPEAGPWRVSLGRAGDELAHMRRPRELHHGDRGELEVVLAGTTWLEVVCTRGATEAVYIRILRRVEQRDTDSLAGAGALPPGPFSGEPGEARRTTGDSGATGDPSDKRAGVPPGERVGADPSPWTTFAGRRLVGGRVIFDRLPAGEELRFAVQRGEVLNESDSSFSMRPDQRARIEFELEAEPLAREAEGEALPLAIRFRTAPLEDDELPAGFHWRE